MIVFDQTVACLGTPRWQTLRSGIVAARFGHADSEIELLADDAVPIVLNLSSSQRVAARSARGWRWAPPPEVGTATILDPPDAPALRIEGPAEVAQIFVPKVLLLEIRDGVPGHITPLINSVDADLSRAVIRCFTISAFDENDAAEEALLRLAGLIAFRARPENVIRKGGVAPLALVQVDELVQAKLSEGQVPSLTDMAAAAGLSRFHFIRAFRESTGETPHRHVLRRRLRRAAGLLSGGGVDAAEAAVLCGFGSASDFGAKFRREMGVRPGEWRTAAIR